MARRASTASRSHTTAPLQPLADWRRLFCPRRVRGSGGGLVEQYAPLPPWEAAQGGGGARGGGADAPGGPPILPCHSSAAHPAPTSLTPTFPCPPFRANPLPPTTPVSLQPPAAAALPAPAPCPLRPPPPSFRIRLARPGPCSGPPGRRAGSRPGQAWGAGASCCA
jgi:hypothetical protein